MQRCDTHEYGLHGVNESYAVSHSVTLFKTIKVKKFNGN